ncbi:MAG: hypothetical protein ACOVSW_01055 [Candidatus Kapaibacteriota bacterium]
MASVSFLNRLRRKILPNLQAESVRHYSSIMLPYQFSAYRIITMLAKAFPFLLLAVGLHYIVSGYILTVDCPICGTLKILLGVAPSLAGGYHLYCMESRFYVSAEEVRRQTIFCVGLYAASTLMIVAILKYMNWHHLDAGGIVCAIVSLFSDVV